MARYAVGQHFTLDTPSPGVLADDPLVGLYVGSLCKVTKVEDGYYVCEVVRGKPAVGRAFSLPFSYEQYTR